MEFTGRIYKVLGERSGTSAKTGNEWKTLQFIFEYFENKSDRYSDKVVLETFDTNVMPLVKEGANVRIGFGHHAREHEGRYYNELRMYKFEALDGQQQLAPLQQDGGTGAAPQAPAPGTGSAPQTQEGGKDDDLPF